MWFMYAVCAGVLAWVAFDVWTKIRADRRRSTRRTKDKLAADKERTKDNPYSSSDPDETPPA